MGSSWIACACILLSHMCQRTTTGGFWLIDSTQLERLYLPLSIVWEQMWKKNRHFWAQLWHVNVPQQTAFLEPMAWLSRNHLSLVIKPAPIQHLATFFTKKQHVWVWKPTSAWRAVTERVWCKTCSVALITSFALGASEAVRTHTSVWSHASSSIETAILTNSYRAEENKNK